MATCPTCAHLAAEGQRFCPSCGTALDVDFDRVPTGTAPRPYSRADRLPSPAPRTPASRAGSRSPLSPSRLPAAGSPAGQSGTGTATAPPPPRFLPGALFADRYRIVALLRPVVMGEDSPADPRRPRPPRPPQLLPDPPPRHPARLHRPYP